MVDKMSKNMANINYKKWVVNIILGKKRKKIRWRIIHRSAIKSATPLEKTHRDGYNVIAKSWMTTLKEVAQAVTRKANKKKYNEVCILCLYLIH